MFLSKKIEENGVHVIIFEPTLEDGREFNGCKVVGDLDRFKSGSYAILANRFDVDWWGMWKRRCILGICLGEIEF